MADKITITNNHVIIDEYCFTTMQEQMLCEQFIELLRESDPQKLNQLRDAINKINQGSNPNF